MFDTILTRERRRLQRIVASFLCAVMIVMCCPVTAFAAPSGGTQYIDENDQVIGTWYPAATDSGAYLGDINAMWSIFDEKYSKVTKITGDIVRDKEFTYNGLANQSPSTLWVMENLIKYLLLMDWADTNMTANETLSTRYNLFFNNTGRSLENHWPALSSEYNDIKDSVNTSGFTHDYPKWDSASPNDCIGPLIAASANWNVTEYDGQLKPGYNGNFRRLASVIWSEYYLPQMTYVLAKSVYGADVSTELDEISRSNVNQLIKTITEKLLQVKSAGTTVTDTSTGEVVTGTVHSYNFPKQIDPSTDLFIGDAALLNMMKAKGWYSGSSYEVSEKASGNVPGIVIKYGDANAGRNASGDASARTTISHLTTLFGSNTIKDYNASNVYIMLGSTAVSSLLNADTGLSSDEKESNAMEKHPSVWQTSDYNTIAGYLTDVSGALDNYSGDKDITVRFCAIPAYGDGGAGDAFIAQLNEAIKERVTELQKNDTYYQAGIYFDYLDTSSATIADGDEIFAKLSNKIVNKDSLTGIDTSGNRVEIENVEGKSGLNTQDLYNVYKNCPEIQKYFDSYKNIEDFVNNLYAHHFQEDNTLAGTTMEGYYTTTGPQVLNIVCPIGINRQLLEDIYLYAYTPNLVGIGADTGPEDVVQDPNEQVDKAESALQLISNCDFGEEHNIICSAGEDGHELSIIGYDALAAGVVYDPFVSVEGNDSYMAVIRDALKGDNATDSSLEKIERFLHQALQRKKPVYVLDGKYDDWLTAKDVGEAPTGNYRYAYVADLLQGDVNITRCYTVMKGGMAPSTVDSDTWIYATGPSRATGTGDRVDDGVTISDGTPAGSQTMATAKEMSAPVMFTCGTTEGFWTGNWAGSANGYAATLGGLTTVILHNAAQDAKDNDYVKNAESYMLFMNGLGDIVLADGTVILPAIANPRIYVYDDIQYSVEGSTSLSSLIGSILGGTAVATLAIASTVSTGGVNIPIILGLMGTAAGAAAGSAAGTATGNVIADVKDFFWDESATTIMDSYEGTYAYYPYNAAFMNHYPSTTVNVEKKLALTNQNDKGKYVIGLDKHGDLLARRITGFNKKTQVNLQYSGGGITVAIPQALSFNVENDVTKIGTLLPYLGGEDGEFLSKANTAVKFEFYMCKYSAYNSDDQAFFPLEDSNEAILREDYLNRAGPLMTSAKRYLMARNPSGDATTAFSGFNAKLYIESMAGEGLMGTMYSETLQKNYQISYDELVQDTGNRLLTMAVQFVESAVDTLGNIDGVLAIKNGYENPFFNLIVSFIQEFYALIAVVLLVIVAVKFLRGHYNMIFVCFIALMCFCGFEVYANWMPTMVPNAYNFAVNDAVEQIVWNTVAVSAESYAETYMDSSRKDPTTGEPKPYTATMTLYKMTRQDMEDMAGRLNTTYTELKKGTIYYLDENAGIFVQGDAIKISLDRLLVNNSMRGLHQSQWQQLNAEFASSSDFITPVTTDDDMVANPYSIQITKPYVSLEAYYMPFNEIERAFLIQINKFASVFRMEHNVFSYNRNLYKDAFVFNNYTNSGIFTAPGSKEVLRENIRVGSVVSRYLEQDMALEYFLSRIYGNGDEDIDPLFPVPEDWLGVAAVFRAPSENFKDSLWGRAMQEHGWYDQDWNITNPDKLNDLIYYINTQTKQFVIENSDQLNFCSDENAIKIVSLYATTAFTHYVTRFGSWLYPNYVNAADISLKDTLYGSMTTLKDRNFSYDGTVVNTVAYNLGVFGVLFILLITIFACVFVFVMTYLVPILYAMFGFVIIFKLINNSDSVGLVKGYIKVTGVTCVLYFIFSLSLRLVAIGGYAWYGYLGCAILMFLCCYFLFWVVLSVVQNAGEMGNDVLGQNLLRGLDHITHGAVRKLTANNLTAQRMGRGYGGREYLPMGAGAYEYGRTYSVDSRDYVRGARGRYASQSRYDDVYEDYGRDSPFDRAASRFGSFGRSTVRFSGGKVSKRFKR